MQDLTDKACKAALSLPCRSAAVNVFGATVFPGKLAVIPRLADRSFAHSCELENESHGPGFS